MQLIKTILFFILGSSLTIYILADTRNSHCSEKEVVAFECQLENSSKVVSICTSNPLSRDKGYVQYRFGKIGNIELKYPTDLNNSQEKFSLTVAWFVGGWRSTLGFKNSEIEYSIYDEAIKESPVSKDYYRGITIWKGNKKLADLPCKKGVQYHNTVSILEDDVPTKAIED